MAETFDFEKALKQLEEILNKIQNNDTSIDESLSLYEQGLVLTKQIEKQLSQIEEKIEKVIVEDEK